MMTHTNLAAPSYLAVGVSNFLTHFSVNNFPDMKKIPTATIFKNKLGSASADQIILSIGRFHEDKKGYYGLDGFFRNLNVMQ